MATFASLFLVLCITVVRAQSWHYDEQRNANINSSTLHQEYVISSYVKPDSFFCMAECNRNRECLVSSFDESTQNCYLYKKYFESHETSYSESKDPSFLRFFSQYSNTSSKVVTLRANFNKTLFSNLRSIDVFKTNNGEIYYYAVDFGTNEMVIFDKDWNYISQKPFLKSFFMIIIDAEIYAASDSYLYKTDLNNVTLAQSPISPTAYRQLWYHEKNDTILAVSGGKVDIFNRNLVLIDNINIPYNGHGVASYENTIYVSTTSSQILVLKNKVIVDIYNISCDAGGYPFSISIDKYGYMAVPCGTNSTLYLYHTNGTRMNKQLSLNSVKFNMFDMNNKLVYSTGQLIVVVQN